MIKLPRIFSNGALFQHSSKITLRGNAEKNADVDISLCRDNAVLVKSHCKSDSNGNFFIDIETPAASYGEYEIKISAGKENLTLSNILFGELWMACGQSNMEMSHVLQPEWNYVKERIQGKKIRAFNQTRLSGDGEYPFEPQEDCEGSWCAPEDEDFVKVSAIATVFSEKIFDFLASKEMECPIGFLNTNRGGSNIETWVPAEEFSKNPRISHGAPNAEKWNTMGASNYCQPSAHYNRHVNPINGVRARGMLWYQGESNVNMENYQHIYKDYMKAVRESYAARFAVSDEIGFPMISVQLFPWKRCGYGDTQVGYINKAFSDMTKMYPDEYQFVPICDLPWIWGRWGNNHPIHPIHKYKIGERLATLVLNRYYGRTVRNKQLLPPMLKSCVRHGNKLRLTFSNVGDGLYVNGEKAVGLYVRSADGVYTPAYYEIVGKNVMNVYHPHIEKPCYVAYAVSSLEPRTNIFAGEFPVTPFCTEHIDGVDNDVRVSLKPWINNELDSAFVGESINITDEVVEHDFFNRAIFNPSCGSGVCYDNDFKVTARSLRVYPLSREAKSFGTYILASAYAPIDFENYNELKLKLFNHKNLAAELVLYYAQKDGTSIVHRIKATAGESGQIGWYEHSFDLSEIPEGKIEKAEFSFTRTGNALGYVFMDDIVLVPKK